MHATFAELIFAPGTYQVPSRFASRPKIKQAFKQWTLRF
jgi:hypothetical protein